MQRKANRGMTLIELMVVVAIIGIAAALAVPSLLQMQASQRLRGVTRDVANAFHLARARAVSTGNHHMVLINAGAGTDPCGNPLPNDPITGAPVPVLVIDDGPPGIGNNCCIDPGEIVQAIDGVPASANAVFWGVSVTNNPPAVPQDPGGGDHTTGSSFADQSGFQTRWVRFRPDGIPVAVNAACNAGQIGTGGGAVYLNNPNRDYAVVLSPLGGVKIYGWEQGAAAWTN